MLVKEPPVQIISGLWMLGSNLYPLYLFKGTSGAILFEGGTGAMGPLVLQQMDALGIDKASVKHLVVTHAHPDHVMAIPLLRRVLPGVKVLGCQTAAATLAAAKALAFFCKIDDALTRALLDAGVITDAHRPEPLTEKQIAVDRIIKEGDTVTVGGDATFKVFETPGHSPCSLSFYEASRKLLLISDATGYYLPKHDYLWPNYFVGYEQYLNSIGRLARLDTEVLCLSHNAVFKGKEDIRAYFDRAIAATQGYHQRIIAEARAGKSAEQIAEALGEEVYAKTQLLPLDFFKKNCALLVQQSLAHEGMSAGA
ncbi:MAG: MBL fold metallo-hydrolase [Planctomycetota bacterium]